jgi:hypothetical protein
MLAHNDLDELYRVVLMWRAFRANFDSNFWRVISVIFWRSLKVKPLARNLDDLLARNLDDPLARNLNDLLAHILRQ